MRRVVLPRTDNTLEVGFCVSALTEALERHGTPEISNTDQGSDTYSGGGNSVGAIIHFAALANLLSFFPFFFSLITRP